MTHAAKTSHDVERDIVVAAAAREPGPEAIRELHLGELFESALGFVVEAIVIKENAHISASLAFILRLPEPGSFFDRDSFQVLILFERTIERRGVAPLFEDAMNFGIRTGDVPSQ